MRITSALIFVASAYTAASATVLPRDECTTGGVQCCNSLQNVTSSNSAQIQSTFSLLGLPLNVDAILGSTNPLVGLVCAPLSLLALGGESCSTQPVCCTNNYIGGLIAVGCNPVNVNA